MTTRFRREVGSTLVAQALALLLNAVTLVLVARWLGPSGKGVQTLITTIGQLVATYGSLGLAGSVPFFVAGHPDRSSAALHNGLRMLLVVVLSALAAGIGGQWVGGLGIQGHEAVLLLLAATTFGQTYAFALLLALREVRWFSSLVVADVVVAFVGTVMAQQLAAGSPDAFVVVQSLGMAVASVLALTRIRSITASMPKHELSLRRQLRVAFLGFLSGAFVQLAARADIFIVDVIGGGLASVGIYSVAVLGSETALRMPQWVAQLLAPRVARDAATKRTTLQLFAMATLWALLASAFVVVLRSPIESLLATAVGAGFVPAYVVVLALLPRVVFQSGTTMLAGHLAGRGYTAYHPIATGAGVLVTLVIDLALVPSLGPIGAGIGASGGAFVTLVIFLIGFRQIGTAARQAP